MDLGLYISFVLVSIVVVAVPGPNVLVIVTTSLVDGRARGLQTIAGTMVAMTIQLGIAATGTAVLAQILSDAFLLLKWVGAAYLIYLGSCHLRRFFWANASDAVASAAPRGSFWRGFLVGITNPKTILFFGAFLPQFTSAALPIWPQIVVLSVTFLVLALCIDGLYALAAGTASELAARPGIRRWLHGSAGVLFCGLGVGLSMARRA